MTGSKVSCRFLQKNHFANEAFSQFEIDKRLAGILEEKDRFRFYFIIPINYIEESVEVMRKTISTFASLLRTKSFLLLLKHSKIQNHFS